MLPQRVTNTAERSAVARCCLNSAAMLHVADSDGDYTNKQRRGFQELNRKQAALLIEAAKLADEMQAEIDLWKGRWEAERQAHQATIDHLHKIMNEEP